MGSALQVYATALTLKKKGHTVRVIDYWRAPDHLGNTLLRVFDDKRKSLGKRVLSVGYKTIELIVMRRNFERFYEQNLCLTKRYHSFEELTQDPPKMDLYITGSDQVWNRVHNLCIDKSYFLDFAPPGCKRIAYAASFGVDELDADEVEETSKLVNRFGAISVREDSALRILEKLGRNDAHHVLDPTMLLTKKEWQQLASPAKINGRYLLIYTVEEKGSAIALECARAIAKEKHLKIYQVTSGGFRQGLAGCDKVFQFTSPDFFLSLLLNADFVVASSFHGTAFSINLEKQFISVLPDRFGGRVQSMLKLVGLQNRAVRTAETVRELCEQFIDYSVVSEKLDKEREKSKEFLEDAINN